MHDRAFTISEDQYYEFLSFLISSAYLLYKGEQYEELYPSFRMMDAAYRLTRDITSHDDFEEGSWPILFLQRCEENFDRMGIDNKAFMDFIDASSLSLAKAMKARLKKAIS